MLGAILFVIAAGAVLLFAQFVHMCAQKKSTGRRQFRAKRKIGPN